MNDIAYAWRREVVDQFGGIIDFYYSATLDWLPEDGVEVCLVRDECGYRPEDVATNPGGYDLLNRGHAYIKHGMLEEVFDCGSTVPSRFHSEVIKKLTERNMNELQKRELQNHA